LCPAVFVCRSRSQLFIPFLFETKPGWPIVSPRRRGEPPGTLEQEKARRAIGASTVRGFTAAQLQKIGSKKTSGSKFFARL